MSPGRPHSPHHRAVAGGILAVLAAGVIAALVLPPDDEPAPAETSALVSRALGTTPTSGPRVGGLDVESRAPADGTLPPPELATLDPAALASDSSPVTGGYTDVIRAHFGEVTVEALVIVQCESGFVPWAVGTNADGTEDHGLFQINDVHAGAFTSVTGEDWEVGRYDPVANTAFARRLYDVRGWEAWTCSERLDDHP